MLGPSSYWLYKHEQFSQVRHSFWLTCVQLQILLMPKNPACRRPWLLNPSALKVSLLKQIFPKPDQIYSNDNDIFIAIAGKFL